MGGEASMNNAGKLVLVDDGFAAVFGYSAKELTGKPVTNLMPSPYAQLHDHFVKMHEKTGRSRFMGKTSVVPGKHANGDVFYVMLSFSKQEMGSNVLYKAYAELPDVVSEEAVETDMMGTIAHCSKTFAEMLGVSRKELKGQPLSALLAPRHSIMHDSWVTIHAKGKTMKETPAFVVDPRGEGDSALALVGVSLGPSEGFKFTAYDFSAADVDAPALVTTFLDGNITLCNNHAVTMYGFRNKKDVLHQNVHIFMAPEVAKKHNQYVLKYKRDKEKSKSRVVGAGLRRVTAKRQDGELFPCFINITRTKIDNNSVLVARMYEDDGNADTADGGDFDDDEEEEGFMVGDYSLSRVLGEGTSGNVYLGTHVKTREKVAIKVFEGEQSTPKMVEREVKILKQLDHPHVVKYVDTLHIDGVACLVMEFVDGVELLEYIMDETRLEEELARKLFRQMLEAVEHFHAHGIVNRDLKLENMLITRDLDIKVIDFSAGNFIPGMNEDAENKLLNTFCGSPDYAAPELWMQQSYAGPEVDVWSLGVTLFSMCCGYMPFDGPKQIVAGHIEYPDHLTKEVRDIIASMLHPSGKARASIDELKEHPWTLGKKLKKKKSSSSIGGASGLGERKARSRTESRSRLTGGGSGGKIKKIDM